MSKSALIVLFMMMSSNLFSTSFCFGESVEVSNNQEAMKLILTNQDYCVDKIVDGKLYLKSDRIYPSREGLFLHITECGDLIRLEHVFSDEEGCYIML